MKKISLIILSLALGYISSEAKDLSKEELKRIKTQLKEYHKNPASFKNMMDKNRETLDSNTAEIQRRKETIDQLSASYSVLSNKATSLEADLKACEAKPIPTCPEPFTGKVPAQGTVYKVQLGLYTKFDMESFFSPPKFIGVEQVDNKKRYSVSYFNTEEEAKEVVMAFRKIGLKGAFVSKYQDGERVYEWNKNSNYKGKKVPSAALKLSKKK